MKVPLSHVPPPTQLQFGQEVFQGGGAVAVPTGWVTRPPLHDLLLQDLLNSVESEMVNAFCAARNCSPTNQHHTLSLACPEALLQLLCWCADIPIPLAKGKCKM